jgi:hypothetical protein
VLTVYAFIIYVAIFKKTSNKMDVPLSEAEPIQTHSAIFLEGADVCFHWYLGS